MGLALAASLVGAVPGLLLIVTGTGLARAFVAAQRELAGRLLGERIPATPPPTGHGLVGRLDARLRDGTGWRCAAYVLAKLPVAAFGWYTVLWWFTGLVNLTTPLRWALFGQRGSGEAQGVPVLTPLPFGGSPVITTFFGTLLAAAVGVATLLIAPWPTRAAVAADRWLIRALLGHGRLAERVRDLEETRALAVDDSAALLRRVERDLHDGAQVRLVALAMSLDMLRERLDTGSDGDRVEVAWIRELVGTAHRNATEALTELRDLARGIHPPVLDDGLPSALATLAARGVVPVELSVDVPERPTPAIETIAYFCAAELLANVIKHSGAHRAALAVTRRDGGGRRAAPARRRRGPGRGPPRRGQRTGRSAAAGAHGGRQPRHRQPGGRPDVITVDLPLRA
ncbi:sensor histidine kinase [Actinomadura sp. HBU206391]|uniref:sensor histidine kinase n=1 Tax=Actinomadura sp. HBU206391 TaxID=2731692 RepID=UPI0021C97462